MEFAVTLETTQPVEVPDTEKSSKATPVTASSNCTVNVAVVAFVVVDAGEIVAVGSVSKVAGA